MSEIRKVQYMHSDNSVDLYRRVDGTRRGVVYARMPLIRLPAQGNATECKVAQWLTTSRWSGGYEASGPVKAGLTFEIVDENQTLYTEEVSEELCQQGLPGAAYAVAPFYDDACKAEAAAVEQTFNLQPHKKWREWLLTDMPEGEEPDNWLYCSSSTICVHMLHQVFVLGKRYVAQATRYRHNASGKEWWAYTIDETKGNKVISTIAICGYRLGKF